MPAKKNMIDSPAINRPRGGDGKHAILDKIVVPKNGKFAFRIYKAEEESPKGNISCRSEHPYLDELVPCGAIGYCPGFTENKIKLDSLSPLW